MRSVYWAAGVIATVLAAAAIVQCSRAHAQGLPCAPHDKMLSRLAAKYGEHVVVQGVSTVGDEAAGKPSALMEMTASEAGSWTLIMTDPRNGVACMVASGWRARLVKPGKGA